MNLPVAAYSRISEDLAGEGLGVARQRQDTETLSRLRGWQVSHYEDNNLSAYDRRKKRPAFEQMLVDLAAGELRGVVAYNLDRLARQPRDLERLIDIYDAAAPGSLVFGTVEGDLDLTSSDGRTMARVMVAFANKSSADTGRRVARKHLELAQAGKPVGGSRPFGWRADKTTLNTEEASLIRQAALAIIAGRSVSSVVRHWQEVGSTSPRGRAWERNTVLGVLRSPRLAGWRTLRGEIALDHDGQPVRGVWAPILTDDEHRALVEALTPGVRRPGVGGKRKYLLSGIARCGECKRTLVGNASARYGGHYYACPSPQNGGCGKVGISGPRLDALVRERVGGIVSPAVAAEPWPGQEELDAVLAQIAELWEAHRTGEAPTRVLLPRITRLEDDAEALRVERDIYLRREIQATERAHREPTLEDEREDIARKVRVWVSRAAARRFDPSRVEVVRLAA